MDKMKIEGIKLSEELFAVNFRNFSIAEDCMSRFYKSLAGSQVNLAFLSGTNLGENSQAFLCVAVMDRARVRELIEAEPVMATHAEFISPVGSMSLFHHQFSLKMLGLILNVFSSTHLPLYGMASSLSTLTLITDYGLLNRSVNAIREYLDVPSDQIYVRPETNVIQTQDVKK